jgi:hypothetical protein
MLENEHCKIIFIICKLQSFTEKTFHSFSLLPLTNMPKPLLAKGFRHTEKSFHCFFTFRAYMPQKVNFT